MFLLFSLSHLFESPYSVVYKYSKMIDGAPGYFIYDTLITKDVMIQTKYLYLFSYSM